MSTWYSFTFLMHSMFGDCLVVRLFLDYYLFTPVLSAKKCKYQEGSLSVSTVPAFWVFEMSERSNVMMLKRVFGRLLQGIPS